MHWDRIHPIVGGSRSRNYVRVHVRPTDGTNSKNEKIKGQATTGLPSLPPLQGPHTTTRTTHARRSQAAAGNYSDACQKLDWTAGGHKEACGTSAAQCRKTPTT